MLIKEFENVEVSIYNNVKTSTGGITSLAEFLATDCSRQIMCLRSTDDPVVRRRIKTTLPAATISGVFHPRRRLTDFVGHSGYICIDLDAKDNPGYDFGGPFPASLTGWDIVTYLSRSASGRGLFAIIRLATPLRHHAHFDSLTREFAQRGFTIDTACGDLTRLRCATFDPVPYYNPTARPHVVDDRLLRPACQPFAPRHGDSRASPGDWGERVRRAIDEARRSLAIRLDNYDDWVRAAFSLAALGEEGRRLFHEAASLSSKYNRDESDRLFSNALRKHNGRLTPASALRLLRGF